MSPSTGITHLLELYDCPPEILDDRYFIDAALAEAVDEAGATLLQQVSRRFVPQGVTALALLAESHISIHTWPEVGYAAVDIFTCGNRAMPHQAGQHLVRRLQAGRHTVHRADRGTDLGVDGAQLGPKRLAALEAS